MEVARADDKTKLYIPQYRFCFIWFYFSSVLGKRVFGSLDGSEEFIETYIAREKAKNFVFQFSKTKTWKFNK